MSAALPSLGHRTNGPDGRLFPWGPIVKVHEIGRYQVVEYLHEHGTTGFHPFVDREDTRHSYGSLEEALVNAIAIARRGPNTQAGEHFELMTRGTL